MFWKSLRTFLFTAPLIALATVCMGTLSMIASLYDRTGFTQEKMARIWARLLLWIGRVRVDVEGLEKLDPNAAYVLVSNHSSYYDTPVILGNIPLHLRFFAKHSLFSIPFLGTHLKRAGYFPVVRDDPRASLKSMADGARQIRERRISALLFPEGGRSLESLREFKEGAAYVAIRAGVPVVPVGIVGARAVLKMHSIHVEPGTIRLRIGDPIPTDGMQMKNRGHLTTELLEKVAELIGEPVPATAPQ